MIDSRLYIFIFGVLFHNIQNAIGMLSMWKGIEYYEEVHQSQWNSNIHSVFMPFTMFGMFIWIPAVFNLNVYGALRFIVLISLFYLGLYARLHVFIAICAVIFYFPTFYFSISVYDKLQTQCGRLVLGLIISVMSLFIQEIFGHYLSGDPSSRLEAIPNAILYAPIYSVLNIFKKK